MLMQIFATGLIFFAISFTLIKIFDFNDDHVIVQGVILVMFFGSMLAVLGSMLAGIWQ